jgi:hypothetical protein
MHTKLGEEQNKEFSAAKMIITQHILLRKYKKKKRKEQNRVFLFDWIDVV